MKIILIGASGTLGRKIHMALEANHEVIPASPKRSKVKVDIRDRSSIEAMYQNVGACDAVVCAAGSAYFGPFDNMTEDDFYTGIRSKMMGQINLVMAGRNYLNDGGSFTLTTGILGDEPVRNGLGLSVVNGAVNAFGMAAAVELKRGLRINVISPGLVEDSRETYGPHFPGHDLVPMHRVINAYLKSILGVQTGQVIRVNT